MAVGGCVAGAGRRVKWGAGCSDESFSRSKAMSFRTKLFLLFLVTVLASVSAVTYSVTHYTRAAYEEMDAQRTTALVSQFQKELAQQREFVASKVEGVSNADV